MTQPLMSTVHNSARAHSKNLIPHHKLTSNTTMSSTDLPSEPEIALAMPKLDISLPEMVGLTLQPGDSSMAAGKVLRTLM